MRLRLLRAGLRPAGLGPGPLLSRSPSRLLVGSSATKFSTPAAQHPAPIFGWPAAQKRQKAERADRRPPAHLLQGGRNLVLSPSSGLALLSLPLPLSLSLGHQIFSACGAAPTLGCPAAQKAESRASRSGTAPSPPPSRGGGVIWSSALAPAWLCSLSPSPSQLVVGHQISRPAAQHPL